MSENEELRQEVERLRALVAGQKAGALEVYAAGEVTGMVTAARAAALEEAALALMHPFGMVFCPTCRGADGITGSDDVTLFCPECEDECGPEREIEEAIREEAVRRIRALVSSPAPATIPVEKVREVLDKASATLARQGYGAGIIRDIARELGVARLDEAGCCDLYGTPHEVCRHAPEREPPLDATCTVYDNPWGIHACAEFAGPAKQPPPEREPCGCVGGFVCAECSGSGNADDS